MRALIYVTIPTGMPIWAQPSADSSQPHIVQLAAMVVDTDTQEVVERDTWLVKPGGWEVPQDVLDDIGISPALATNGAYESLVLNGFYIMWKKCDHRVSYGEVFHSRIIRIAIKRYMADSIVTEWKAGNETSVCAMRRSTNVLKIPQQLSRGKYKFPKLGEAYQYFTGEKLPEKASIEERLDACREIYFGLMDANA